MALSWPPTRHLANRSVLHASATPRSAMATASSSNPSAPRLPLEIIERIALHLPRAQCFRIAVALRLGRLRDLCVPGLCHGMYAASARGDTALLAAWMRSGFELAPAYASSGSGLDAASAAGHVHVLEWWLHNSDGIWTPPDDGADDEDDDEWWVAQDLSYEDDEGAYSNVHDQCTRAGCDEGGADDTNDDDDGLRLRVMPGVRGRVRCAPGDRRLRWSSRAMDGARTPAVLQWWLDSGLPLRYTTCALANATAAGRCDVLAWWRASPLELRYNQTVADRAPNSAVLDWWRDSGLRFECSPLTLQQAASTDVLDWWLASGLPLQYSNLTLDVVEDPAILAWWAASGLELRYSHRAIDRTAKPEVLERWFASGLELKYTTAAMDFVPNTALLQCWATSGLDLKYTTAAIDNASSPAILDWWVASGLELKYTAAVLNGYPAALRWWQTSPLPAKWTAQQLADAISECDRAEREGEEDERLNNDGEDEGHSNEVE
ncbi:hypothetical protein HDU86_001356 [Geranomyces michiganensis]|nr:hypothetical protein HDU86_001356 [Geranomyces michiganensis]